MEAESLEIEATVLHVACSGEQDCPFISIMSDSIRTFVAIKFPVPPALQSVLRKIATMNWPVAAVSSDKLHVTLKFLGDTPSELSDGIRERIAESVRSQPPFVMRVVGLGAFPHVERPSVVWAGLYDAEPLVMLAQRLEASLESLGFARESRPFHPHLTLARVKGRPPRALLDLLRQHSTTDFGSVEVQSVEFIRSDLKPDGSRYSTLATYELV